MGYDRATSLDMVKEFGISNTIGVMETHRALGPWARGGWSTLRGFDPDDLPWAGDGRPFGGGHKNITNAGMLDGSVRVISNSMNVKDVSTAIILGGNKTFSSDW
jgi:hypothetical protein